MFVKILLLVGLVVLIWSASAHSSQAHGSKRVVTVQRYQTLWTIAEAHYGGDARSAVWRIERANHLAGAGIQPGQRLVLP
jgi:nucleoid-associated protein YgaU